MEIIAVSVQNVGIGQNVFFTQSPVKGNCSIFHRDGSGLVTLRGITSQCRARYKITFGANVALPTGATVAPITFAIAINGEEMASTTMISTPAAVEEFNNIASSVFIDVPSGCCYNVSIKNIGTTTADVENANLIVERVA